MTEEVSPRASVLREAESLICGDRNVTYGSPTENFDRIAALWTVQFAHLLAPGAKFEPKHVAEGLIHVKMSRNISDTKRDNWVDLAGYAACGYETTVDTSKQETQPVPAVEPQPGVSEGLLQLNGTAGPARVE